jgi:hypothetical protein
MARITGRGRQRAAYYEAVAANPISASPALKSKPVS